MVRWATNWLWWHHEWFPKSYLKAMVSRKRSGSAVGSYSILAAGTARGALGSQLGILDMESPWTSINMISRYHLKNLDSHGFAINNHKDGQQSSYKITWIHHKHQTWPAITIKTWSTVRITIVNRCWMATITGPWPLDAFGNLSIIVSVLRHQLSQCG